MKQLSKSALHLLINLTTHTNNTSTCTTTDAKVHSITIGILTDLLQITIVNVKNEKNGKVRFTPVL